MIWIGGALLRSAVDGRMTTWVVYLEGSQLTVVAVFVVSRRCMRGTIVATAIARVHLMRGDGRCSGFSSHGVGRRD